MKRHYVLPNNVHDTEAGMPEYCMFYDAAEADAHIAELKKALRTCVEAIDFTYDQYEARGIPRELYEAGQQARALMETGSHD
jgi:hypothetical protein